MKYFNFKDTDMYRIVRYTGVKTEREQKWLAARNEGIGGADSAAVMNVSPWETAYKLWQVKTGRADAEDISGKWAVQKGHVLEGALRDRFRSLHKADGWKITDGTLKTMVSRKFPYMRADLDGVILTPDHKTPGVLEIKTANRRTDWEDGEGGYTIPLYYLTQVTHYLMVTGWTWGFVYVAFPVGEPVEIEFTRNEDDIKALMQAEASFWNCVETVTAPPLTGIADVKEASPEDDGAIISVDGDVADDIDQLAVSVDRIDDQIKDLKAERDKYTDRLAVYVNGHKALKTSLWQVSLPTRHYKAVPEHVVPAKPARVMRGSISVKKLSK